MCNKISQKPIELELELIQFHMAQKPMLRGEVGCARGEVYMKWARERCACGQCRERRYWRARVCKALGWVGVDVKPIRACCRARGLLCCGATSANKSTVTTRMWTQPCATHRAARAEKDPPPNGRGARGLDPAPPPPPRRSCRGSAAPKTVAAHVDLTHGSYMGRGKQTGRGFLMTSAPQRCRKS